MSIGRDHHLTDREVALRRGAQQAIASSRLEGLEPTEAEVALMERVSRGELSTAEAVAQALEPYRR